MEVVIYSGVVEGGHRQEEGIDIFVMVIWCIAISLIPVGFYEVAVLGS